MKIAQLWQRAKEAHGAELAVLRHQLFESFAETAEGNAR
jgi:hypothetical protein